MHDEGHLAEYPFGLAEIRLVLIGGEDSLAKGFGELPDSGKNLGPAMLVYVLFG